MTNTTVINSTQHIFPEDYIIWILNDRASKNNLPAIIFTGVMMLFGAFGNGFTIYIFRFRFKQTSVHIFIAWLAIFDIISCCTSMPFELFEMRFPLMYGEPISCKVFRIIGFTAAMTSSMIMIYIAFDRYYTLCNPFHKFSTKKAKYLILIGFSVALVFAWPPAIIMGSKSIPTDVPGIVGTDCSYDDSVVNTLYPRIYYFILSFFVILCLIILIVVYIKIGIGIWRWKHFDIGDSITDNLSVSTYSETGLNSNRKKRFRSHSLPPNSVLSVDLSEHFEKETEVGKLNDEKVDIKIPKSQQNEHPCGNEHVLQADECDLQIKTDIFPIISSKTQITDKSTGITKSKRRFSMDSTSDNGSIKKEKDLKRNVSLPDLLQNIQASHTTSSTQSEAMLKPTHGILVKRNISNESTNNSKSGQEQRQLQKRISLVDFKLDNYSENMRSRRPTSLSQDGVHHTYEKSNLSVHPKLHSNVRKLRKCLSLDSSEIDVDDKQKRGYLNNDTSPKIYNRQLSSSSVKSFKRRKSVKDRARIGRSNAMFVAITVVFVLSYIPFFTLEILKITGMISLDSTSDLAIQLFEIGTKSQYINNVANPFIYGMLNSKYRKELKKLFFNKSFS